MVPLSPVMIRDRASTIRRLDPGVRRRSTDVTHILSCDGDRPCRVLHQSAMILPSFYNPILTHPRYRRDRSPTHISLPSHPTLRFEQPSHRPSQLVAILAPRKVMPPPTSRSSVQAYSGISPKVSAVISTPAINRKSIETCPLWCAASFQSIQKRRLSVN